MSKIAMVTGGNSGIGLAVAERLKDHGYIVLLVGRNADSVRAEARRLGAEPFIVDLAQARDIKMLADAVSAPGLDVLVNSAAIARCLPIDDYDEASFNEHINVNLKAPILLMKYLLPALEQRGGAVTMVSSIITQRAAPVLGLYAATKGAVESFVRNAAVELAGRNIRINAVCPGPIDTPMFDKLGLSAEQVSIAKRNVIGTAPMGRLGRPEEVADVIVAQLHATYVTGSVWAVDGGVHC